MCECVHTCIDAYVTTPPYTWAEVVLRSMAATLNIAERVLCAQGLCIGTDSILFDSVYQRSVVAHSA